MLGRWQRIEVVGMPVAQQWVRKGATMAPAGRIQEGHCGAPVSGLRRDAQRLAAMPSLRAPSDTFASQARRRPPPGFGPEPPEMFQMDIGSLRAAGDHEPQGENAATSSDTCSEASSDNNLPLKLADFLDHGRGGGGVQALGAPEPPPFRPLARNLSGHLPVSKSSNGALLKTKAYGKLMRSFSGHRPRSSRDWDSEQAWSQGSGESCDARVCAGTERGAGKLSFAPTFRQIPQRVDVTRHSWPIKSCEAPSTRGHFAGGEMVQSAPVAVPQCARKGHHFEDDDDEGAFMPPHEFLSRTETKRDPHQALFANPSAGRLKGLTSLRIRNIVLTKTGFYDGYTEMWQCPARVSAVPFEPF